MKNFYYESSDIKLIPDDVLKFTSVVNLTVEKGNSAYFPDYLIILDEQGNILSFNNFEPENYYFLPKLIKGKNISDVFPDSIVKEITSAVSRTMQMNEVTDLEYTIPINSINRIFHGRFIPSGDNEIILMVRDVTKLMRAEEALEQTDLRFRSVWENSIDGMRLLDRNGNIVAANKAYSDLTGLKSEDYLGQPFPVVYKTSNDKETETSIIDFKDNFYKRSIKSFYETEAEFISGRSLSVEVFNVFIESSNEEALEGEVLLLTIFRDITERKKSENELRNSELRFRSIWENSVDGMRLTDADGVIVAVNNSFCHLTGYQEKDLTGNYYTDIYINKTDEEKKESLLKYKDKFKERKFQLTRQSRTNFILGKILDLEVTYSIIEYKSGEPLLLAIFHDVTERVRAEEELRKSETLAAIGRMAAYLSHEIKTPLASIRMNIDLIAPEIAMAKQKSLKIIQKEIKRLNKLLRNVLQFSRTQELHVVSVNVSGLLNSIKDLIEPQLKDKNIEFINRLGQSKVNGDYQKLQSVFLHLIENSIEAIDSSGTIELYAEEDEENDTTTIFIKDSGCGIKDDLGIFEPFYTTKHTGTGLGLAIAQRIIEQHNGDLRLHSSVPGETIFAIRFFNYGV
jgi:two-component system, sporulation sensor kinase E